MSLSKESLAEAKHKLEALDKKDAERRKTAELKNNLEGYIYNTKEKVGVLKVLKLSMSHFYLSGCHAFTITSFLETYKGCVGQCY